jgi:hypothetical protein
LALFKGDLIMAKTVAKKCYIVKSGARWVAHSMATENKRLGSSTKSRSALQTTMEGKGWSCAPASSNPKPKKVTKVKKTKTAKKPKKSNKK